MRSLLTDVAVAVLLALATATPVSAQLLRGNSGCKFSNPPDIAFGAYVDGQSAALHTVAALEITCKNVVGIYPQVTAGPGSNSGDLQDRRLRHKREGDLLRYQLYVDSAHTRVWGDGTRGTEPIALTTPGSTKHATIYAEMPGGQGGSEGDYDDSIVVTVLP